MAEREGAGTRVDLDGSLLGQVLEFGRSYTTPESMYCNGTEKPASYVRYSFCCPLQGRGNLFL